MLKSAKELLDQFPNIKFKMAIASKMIKKELEMKNTELPIEFIHDSRALIAEAHASIVASGTVSLEHALIGTPCVVVYKLSKLSYALASLVVKKEIQENCHGFIALPNILAKKRNLLGVFTK